MLVGPEKLAANGRDRPPQSPVTLPPPATVVMVPSAVTSAHVVARVGNVHVSGGIERHAGWAGELRLGGLTAVTVITGAAVAQPPL